MTDDYIPTPSLPDDKGKALLQELGRLYEVAGERQPSLSDCCPVEELRDALAEVADVFDSDQDFRTWLLDSDRWQIEHVAKMLLQADDEIEGTLQ